MSRVRIVAVLVGLIVLSSLLALACHRAVVELQYARADAQRREQQAAIVDGLAPLKSHAVYSDDGSVTFLSLICDNAQECLDPQLASLQSLDHLYDLRLHGCSLSEDGLRVLGKLNSVTKMDFRGVTFASMHLRYLTELPRLRSLTFHDCPLSDAGLEQLAKIEELKRLEIMGSHLTDAAVVPLSRMSVLERLVLDSTPLSEDAYDRLRDALPQTEIVWTPWDPEDRRPGHRIRKEVMSRRMREQETRTDVTDQ